MIGLRIVLVYSVVCLPFFEGMARGETCPSAKHETKTVKTYYSIPCVSDFDPKLENLLISRAQKEIRAFVRDEPKYADRTAYGLDAPGQKIDLRSEIIIQTIERFRDDRFISLFQRSSEYRVGSPHGRETYHSIL